MKQIFPIVLLACILMTSCSNSDDYFTPENLCDEPQHSQMSEDSVKQIYQQMRMIVREQVAKDVIEYKEKTNDATVPKIVTGADYLAFLMNRPEYIEKYCQENADAIYASEKKSSENEKIIREKYNQEVLDDIYSFSEAYREAGGNSTQFIDKYIKEKNKPLQYIIIYLGVLLDEYGLCSATKRNNVTGDHCYQNYMEEMDAHSARTTIDDMAIPLLIDGGGYIIGGALGGLVKGIDSYRTHKALDNYIKCRRNTI